MLSNSPVDGLSELGRGGAFGYLLAAFGPVMVGGLQDISGSWTLPLTLLAGVSVLMLLMGVASGKNRQVSKNA